MEAVGDTSYILVLPMMKKTKSQVYGADYMEHSAGWGAENNSS